MDLSLCALIDNGSFLGMDGGKGSHLPDRTQFQGGAGQAVSR